MKKLICIISALISLFTFTFSMTACKKDTTPVVPKDEEQVLVKSGHKLVVGGNTEYVILLPQNCTTNEITAAKDLHDIIFEATEAELEIVYEGSYNVTNSTPVISIGDTELAKSRNVRTDNTDLLRSGYVLKTMDNQLFIMADGNGNGLYYAVYDFCEDAVGYRYYYIDEVYYDKKSTVDLYSYDEVVKPSIDFRATLYPTVSSNEDYRRHLRYFVWNEEYYTRAHTQTAQVVNYDTFKSRAYGSVDKDGNPNHWFSNASNTKSRQLCWTAGEEMERQAAKDIFDYIVKEQIDKQYFHLGQADNSNFCTCARCEQAKKDYAYNDAGLQIVWANHVCEYLQELLDNAGMHDKDIKLVLFAYMGTETPPVIKEKNGTYRLYSDEVKINDMITYEWAPIYTDYSVSYTHSNNELMYNNVKMWNELFKICGLENKMSVWTYETNFKNFMYMFDNASTFAENMQFFAENGINNVFSQGANTTNQPTMQEMKLFVQSQIMWDPTKNYDELVDEFMEHFYKDAAPFMREYYDLIRMRYKQAQLLDGAQFSSIYSNIGSNKIWTLDFVSALDRLFDKAYSAINHYATEDRNTYAKLYDRLKEVEITLMYAKLSHYNNKFTQEELDLLIDEYKFYCNKYNIVQNAESESGNIQNAFDDLHS